MAVRRHLASFATYVIPGNPASEKLFRQDRAEYLRIIYGPDYDRPENIVRLNQRGLGQKRSMAIREFALRLEALHCFVEHAPLIRVHQCVFGVLAMESEPFDPRS